MQTSRKTFFFNMMVFFLDVSGKLEKEGYKWLRFQSLACCAPRMDSPRPGGLHSQAACFVQAAGTCLPLPFLMAAVPGSRG